MATPTIEEQSKVWFDLNQQNENKKLVTLQSSLACPIAVEYFKLHCTKELNDENLLAYLEIRAMKQNPNMEEFKQAAHDFYRTFIAVDAKIPLNIEGSLLDELREKIEKEDITLDMFDTIWVKLLAQLEDPFQRFLESDTVSECIPMCWYNNALFCKKLTESSKKNKLLNNLMEWTQPVRHACTVVSGLLLELKSIVRKAVDSGDFSDINLDFMAIRKLPEYAQFAQKTSELAKVKLDNLSYMERKAFFINLYNLMILHATVENQGIPSVELMRTVFFRKSKYAVDTHEFSLDNILNGVLRDNVKDWMIGSRFKPSDPRKAYCVPIDPRVHFTLLSLNHCSPSVAVAPADNLDNFLTDRTELYLNTYVETSSKQVKVPRIFSNFKADFGKSKSAIQDFVIKYASKLTPEEQKTVAKSSPNFSNHYWRFTLDFLEEDYATQKLQRRESIMLHELEAQQICKDVVTAVKRHLKQ